MKDHRLAEAEAKELLGSVSIQQTRWCIITGPPCSGKTTVIGELAMRGYRTNPDMSRQYFEEQIAAGLDIDHVRRSGCRVHRGIFLQMLLNAASLPSNQLIFHDYGLPDNVAFRLAEDLQEDPDLMRSCASFRYWKVFLLAPAPFARDRLRREDAVFQHRLAALLPQVYSRLGYSPIMIPLESLHDRCERILSHLPATSRPIEVMP